MIKGSEWSLESEGGFLDRASYVQLSWRSFNTFYDRRETVYDLFEKYWKGMQYDVASRYVIDTLLVFCGILKTDVSERGIYTRVGR